MDVLKQFLTYAVMIIVLWLALTFIPRWTSRAQVPSDYNEIDVPDVEKYPSYAMNSTIGIEGLNAGDAICYRAGDSEGAEGNGFGFVAAVPGDVVTFTKGVLEVNGKPYAKSGKVTSRPDMGPLVIPAHHVFVVTTLHTTDSLARGPLPALGLRGKLEQFP